MIENIIDYAITSFNLGYVISINVLSYLIISIVSYITKKTINKGIKIIITCICSILMFLLYREVTIIESDILINSTILAPVAWDWVIKPICRVLKVDYK